MMMILFIYISISSIACEMCELCEIFPKLSGSIEIQLTEELTEPNNISHISQDPIILDELLLVTQSNSQGISQLMHRISQRI